MPSNSSYSDYFDISIDSFDETLEAWEVLLRHLMPTQMEKLNSYFSEKGDKGLTKEEFVNSIDNVFDNCRYSIQAISLFDRILSTKPKIGEGIIFWTDCIEFIADKTKTTTTKYAELTLKSIFNVSHIKREAIIKIVLIEMENFFCYAIVAKYGGVGLYDGNMNFLTSYHVIMSREDVTRSDRERRRRNRWITDAIFLPDSLMFVISNSTRCLTIYDASGLEHIPMWLITDFPGIIERIAYCTKNNDSRLVLGEDSGQLFHLKFVQPNVSFFRKKHTDRISIFYWLQLLRYEKEYVIVKSLAKSHSETICQLEYFEGNHTLVSCSRGSTNSVIIQQLFPNGKDYHFKMHKGATCFALSRNFHHLLTGSDDGILRIWNQFVTKKAIETIPAHSDGIIDVKIIDHLQYAITCSRKAEIKLWDIKHLKCIQKLSLKFPCFGVLGKLIEWGTSSLFPGPKRYQHLKVSETPSINCIQDNDDDCNKHDEDRASEKKYLDQWNRKEIYVTCCNFIAHIKVDFLPSDEDGDGEMPVLPPPPLQNSVLIPKTWKVRKNDVNINVEQQTYPEEVEKYVDSLKFILEKDFLNENNMKNEINYRIAQLEAKKLEMHDKVKQCAPYLALDLFEVEEVKLPTNLPIPTRKRTQRLVEKTQRMLSAASSKSAIFSESSSRSRSSRSSIMEF